MKVVNVNTRQTYGTAVEDATINITEREAKFLYHALYVLQNNARQIIQVSTPALQSDQDNLMLIDKMKMLLMPALREILVQKPEEDFLTTFDPIAPEEAKIELKKKSYPRAAPAPGENTYPTRKPGGYNELGEEG